MGGFLGIGQSGGEKSATSNLSNIFNYALPTAENNQNAGQNTLNSALSTLGPAQSYYQNLLTAGRTQTAQSSAPAINSALSSADAQRRQEATSGTGRTGGTAELNREAGAGTSSTIDNIINQTLQTGRQAGAQGLQGVAGAQAGIGGTSLSNAIANLGIASGGEQSLYSGAIAKEGQQSATLGGIADTGIQAGASFALAHALGLI